MSDGPESIEPETGASLIAALTAQRDAQCRTCGLPLCYHQLLANYALGIRSQPRCVNCISQAMEQNTAELRAYLFAYFQRRACYAEAWSWASQVEGSCSTMQSFESKAEPPLPPTPHRNGESDPG